VQVNLKDIIPQGKVNTPTELLRKYRLNYDMIYLVGPVLPPAGSEIDDEFAMHARYQMLSNRGFTLKDILKS